jgi:hypothetical protein
VIDATGGAERSDDRRTMSKPIELYRHYRAEVQQEMGLMPARLSALLTSQSFLMIAYAAEQVGVTWAELHGTVRA